ncbi:MAG: DNA primase [Kiloniellales bacterium]|nr:DNA primase [Kiloniellales bacterium]
MAFPPEFLDEIRARLGLAEVIGRKVKLTRRGREHSGLCPFHNEKTPSFTVSEDKGFYHCFGCGAHGDVIGFVMRNEGLAFPEAVERLAAEAGLAVPQRSPEDQAAEQRRSDLLAVLEQAAGWFEEQLASGRGAGARDYLAGRGLSAATIGAFRLGFAPNERGLLRQALNARGIDNEQLAEAGLVKLPEAEGSPSEIRDYFFNRVIFPITDRRGRVIAFGGRALGESPAKYLNSPETALFHKGRVLYNLARARPAAHDSGELIVAEGYMDVIALAQAGFPAAVAPLGTAVTEEQIAALWRLTREPVLCLDGDQAGRRAGYRALERALPLLQPGFSLRFAILPAGQDPDDLIRQHGAAAFRQVLDQARPLADLLWQREFEAEALDTPERRAGLRRRLREAVGQVRDTDVREAYRQEMEARFDQAFGRPGGRRGADRAGRGRSGRRYGGFDPLAARQRRDGQVDVRVPPPVRQSPALLGDTRREQVLLATLVNHPELIAEQAEVLAGTRFENRDLQRLSRALVDLATGDPGLDTAALKRQLCDQGFAEVLRGLLDRRVYELGPFARAEAPLAEAQRAWGHVLALHRERQLQAEAAEVRQRFAEQMDEANLARLRATQEIGREDREGEYEDVETARADGPQVLNETS